MEVVPGGAIGRLCIQFSIIIFLKGVVAACALAKTMTWQYLHGMIEMFTYLNLPILFGIILLCRIINIARYMYLVVQCSPKMKCLVTSYVKTKYNNFANINLFKVPECEGQKILEKVSYV